MCAAVWHGGGLEASMIEFVAVGLCLSCNFICLLDRVRRWVRMWRMA